jgi:hypothetical protein
MSYVSIPSCNGNHPGCRPDDYVRNRDKSVRITFGCVCLAARYTHFTNVNGTMTLHCRDGTTETPPMINPDDSDDSS